MPETAYKVAVQDTYPSWGWWIVNGATTLLENWNLEATRDISDNHMMFGEIGGWFFKGLGGIKPTRSAGLQTHPAAPEFRRPRGIRGFARRPLRADRVGMDAPGQYGDLPRPNPGQQYRNALPAGQRGRREGASAGCRKPYADAQGGQMTLPPGAEGCCRGPHSRAGRQPAQDDFTHNLKYSCDEQTIETDSDAAAGPRSAGGAGRPEGRLHAALAAGFVAPPTLSRPRFTGTGFRAMSRRRAW